MADAASEPQSAPLLRGLLHDLRRTWLPLAAYEVAFKALAALVVVPAGAWALARLVAVSGRTAVSNEDLLGFLLTPTGLAVAVVMGVAALSVSLLEHTGALAVIALTLSGRGVSPRRAATAVALGVLRVLRLGAAKLAVLVLEFAPVVALAVLTYLLFLSHGDINWYLADRPPAFWAAAAVAAMLAAVAAVLGALLYVRWALALPILLFEGVAALAALRESRRRVRGAVWRVGGVLLGWHALTALAGAVLLGLFRLAASAALAKAGRAPTAALPTVTGLLVLHGLLTAGLSVAFVVGHCLLLWRLHRERGGRVPDGLADAAGDRARSRWPLRLVAAGALGTAATSVLLGAGLTAELKPPAPFAVIAHRGHSTAAPENTLAAVRAAIAAGADAAEIDVQLTADGALILLHDADFRRVAGDPRRPGQMTLAEVKQLDVGRHFDERFAGERVPTLGEVIAVVRGRVGLNVELKFYGRDRRLAEAVAGLLRAADFEDDALVASLTHDGLAEAKRHNPRLRTAAIVTVAVGDVGRLDVDALELNKALATDRLLRQARRRGKEVLVWTVDDPAEAERLIERGVRQFITNAPDALAALRRERAERPAVERLLRAARHLIADE